MNDPVDLGNILILADGSCGDGDCPLFALTDRGSVVVKGDAVAAANGLSLGPGEQAVEVPAALLLEAARALGG